MYRGQGERINYWNTLWQHALFMFHFILTIFFLMKWSVNGRVEYSTCSLGISKHILIDAIKFDFYTTFASIGGGGGVVIFLTPAEPRLKRKETEENVLSFIRNGLDSEFVSNNNKHLNRLGFLFFLTIIIRIMFFCLYYPQWMFVYCTEKERLFG